MRIFSCTCRFDARCAGTHSLRCLDQPYGCFCGCGCEAECFGCDDCLPGDDDWRDDDPLADDAERA